MRHWITNFIFIVYLSLGLSIANAKDAPPVEELRHLYNTNASFKADLEKALREVKPRYNGTDNLWVGKSFDDFCAFFNDWYALLPVNGELPKSSLFLPGQKVDTPSCYFVIKLWNQVVKFFGLIVNFCQIRFCCTRYERI